MKNFTSILGWLLLLAVLAVPSFLFYNWLSKSKQQNQAELVHEPMAGNVFPSEKGGPAAAVRQVSVTPVQQGVKAEELKPAGPAKTAPAAALTPAAPARQLQEQAPSPSAKAPAAVPAPAQQPSISTAAQQGAAQEQVAVSTVPKQLSSYSPKTLRDPTFSPDDYRRIKEEAMRREEADRMMRDAEARRTRDPGVQLTISLQGVVGNAAIINGEMYSVGQSVRGAKILKVGADYVIVEYKGRKFKKVLK